MRYARQMMRKKLLHYRQTSFFSIESTVDCSFRGSDCVVLSLACGIWT